MFPMSKQPFGWIALALATLFVAGPAALAADRTLTVTMSEPFEVSGVVYPSGMISLHEVRAYSPVATLHEIRIDGRSLGVLMARDGASDAPSVRDSLIFSRNASGHLVLTSVARKGEPVRELYHLSARADGRQWSATATADRPVLVATK